MEQEQDATGEPLGKLIQRCRVEHATIVAHQRELDRRRAAVGAAAERDASEIVAAARRDIRGVLLRAHQELATLTAQVREVGLESRALRAARSELADLSHDATRLIGPSRRARRQSGIAGVIEHVAEHWRTAVVAVAVLAAGALLFAALLPSSTTEDAGNMSRPEASSGQKPSVPDAPATEQAAASPTATRGSDVHPLKPAPASGVSSSSKPNAPPPATVTRQSVAPLPAPESPKRAAATAPDRDVAAEREIVERHQRWFEAFNRGDHATMASFASDNFSIADERAEHASAPSGQVERTIRDVRVRVTGVGAVLSGQIAETTPAGEAVPVAMLSEVWIRRGDEWRLASVRMVPVDAVPKTLQ